MRTKNQNTNDLYYFSEQLTIHLAGMERYPLTIVEAPSGFGKTTAVQEYLKEHLPQSACEHWYTCLGEPTAKAWNGICDLFARIDSEVAEGMNKLEAPTADTLADFAALSRKLHCPSETYLIIDNYQLVGSNIPRQMLGAFSVHRNTNLHIIIITQQLKGEESTVHHANIHTINADSLMFDRKSTSEYFRISGIRLTDSELDSIHNSTEGWVSAIRLQMLNYKQTGVFERTNDIEQLVKTAVWNRLSEDEKIFFLAVSILEGFTTKQAQIMLSKKRCPSTSFN